MTQDSGAVFALWWRNGEQEAAFVDYGPEDLKHVSRTLREANRVAAMPPPLRVELLLCCSIVAHLVEHNRVAAGRDAAALAQHTGWRFSIVTEDLDQEVSIQHAPEQDRASFERMVMSGLKLIPGPPGLKTSPLPPEELIRGPRTDR